MRQKEVVSKVVKGEGDADKVIGLRSDFILLLIRV